MDLLEAVFHTAKAVRGKSKTTGIKNGLLHTSDETELQCLADFTNLPEEAQIENQGLVLSAPKVIQQLVDDHEQPMLREFLVELFHHVLEGRLVLGNLVGGGKGEIDPKLQQVASQCAGENFAQTHRCR